MEIIYREKCVKMGYYAHTLIKMGEHTKKALPSHFNFWFKSGHDINQDYKMEENVSTKYLA